MTDVTHNAQREAWLDRALAAAPPLTREQTRVVRAELAPVPPAPAAAPAA